jgi:hypothetical protein
MKDLITLLIAGIEYKFNVTVQDHSDFIDSTARGESISAAAHNFVMRTVDSESKDGLKKLLESSPGSELQIATLVKTEFSPMLEMSIKK